MTSGLADRILNHVREQDVLLIDLLRSLVEAESPSSHPAVHKQARHLFMSALSELDFLVRETGLPSGPRHVYARPRECHRGKDLQLIIGHYDTVWPVGTAPALAGRPLDEEQSALRPDADHELVNGRVTAAMDPDQGQLCASR